MPELFDIGNIVIMQLINIQ